MTPTIGVFDSGFGGLTVLRALMAQIPRARFAFFGDTARLPYGSKSRRTIARYAAQCAQFLVSQQGAEFLVIACNTASALALDAIQDAVQVPVLGVIEPGAEAARAASRTGDVLVIATDATVQSHAYAAACRARGLRALEKACPLLVPLVEEGWTGPLPALGISLNPMRRKPCLPHRRWQVTAEVIRIYLAELTAEAAAQGMNPDVLLLGCTHYPLLRPLLERAVPPRHARHRLRRCHRRGCLETRRPARCSETFAVCEADAGPGSLLRHRFCRKIRAPRLPLFRPAHRQSRTRGPGRLIFYLDGRCPVSPMPGPWRTLASMIDLSGKTAVVFGLANKRSIAWGIAQKTARGRSHPGHLLSK